MKHKKNPIENLESANRVSTDSGPNEASVGVAETFASGDVESIERRNLIKRLATIGAAGLAFAVAGGVLDPLTSAANAQDAGVQQYRWGMVIDTRRCVGCRACTVACKAENKTPPGVSYSNVHTDLLGDRPGEPPLFMTKQCFHCEVPFCVPVCPVDATWKRASDGIVVVDYDKCIGSGRCVTACPYGNRYMDEGNNYPAVAEDTGWAGVPSPEYDQFRVRTEGEPPIGKVRKCTFCMHLQDENGQYNKAAGLWPSCVKTCTGHALHFGDFNDPESDVSRLLNERSAIRLKENLGTDPNVYYLM